jgi:DNA-binding transcriptional regulator YdaS (Cro superfamily)
MSKQLTPSERAALAELGKTDPAYLYQCLTGRRNMGPVEAVRVEKATKGKLRRWDLCPGNWHLIWPELIGKKGAPTPEAAPEKTAAV